MAVFLGILGGILGAIGILAFMATATSAVANIAALIVCLISAVFIGACCVVAAIRALESSLAKLLAK